MLTFTRDFYIPMSLSTLKFIDLRDDRYNV